MADADGAIKEWVEGFDSSGKPLERITKSELLQEQQKQMKKEEVNLNVLLQTEQCDITDLQNRLKECNDDYALEKQKLDELKSEQRVTLDSDQKSKIVSVCKETMDRFVRKRPRNEDEQMMVDVHFLTGTETTGFNLHINGEGAGSRDAKFLVQLNQKVQSLATQAAKYWGLDPDKVFFLDRDGRIVLDNMNLVDIILPPVPASASASSSAAAPAAAGGGTTVGTVAIPDDSCEVPQEKDLWMVRGRNYCLTLVRASTVLSKEDLNRPKGEKWEDFTFNEAQLDRELENTRRKRGGEDGEAGKINMDAIPSLNDLMQHGKEKKRKKRADTRCRLFEFMVFVVCELLFLAALVHPEQLGPSLLLMSNGLERALTNFTAQDNATAFGHARPSFSDIQTTHQYWQWLDGPFRRVLMEGAGELHSQMTVLRTLTTRFEASDPELNPLYAEFGLVKFCDEVDAAADENASNTSNDSTETSTTTFTSTGTVTSTETFTITTSTATATTATATSTSTTTSTQVNFTATFTTRTSTTHTSTITSTTSSTTRTNNTIPNITVVPYGDVTCIPAELRSCYNIRVMYQYGKALDLGHQVPECRPQYWVFTPHAYLSSLIHEQVFSYTSGKGGVYFDGLRSKLEFDNGTETFYESLQNFTGSSGELFEFVGAAHQLSVFSYSPSMNAAVIYHLVIENTLAGGLQASVNKDLVHLDQEPAFNNALMILSAILGVVLFLMEVRRILHCPKALTFEEERSRCSLWSLLFLLLPFFVFAILGLLYVQDELRVDILEELAVGLQTTLGDSRNAELVWQHMKLDRSALTMKIMTVCLFNLLMIRFLLMHFPQFIPMTSMMTKVVRPMSTVLLFLVLALFSSGVFWFTVYGAEFWSFHGPLNTYVSVLLWSMGYLRDWPQYFKAESILWPLSVLVTFLIIQLTLNLLPAAILLSYQKDAMLSENYSDHPFWASERSKGNIDPQNFDVARIGWDFSGKEPRQVLQS